VILDALDVPIVLAPLAGGPSTPALCAAVCEAGGLGFLAAGYRSPDELAGVVAQTRAPTARAFGVNVFVPGERPAEPATYAPFVERLRAAGLEPGEPRFDDDGWEAKLALLCDEPPAVVSFTFGCPPTGSER
jgi:nitronate monooxygenase